MTKEDFEKLKHNIQKLKVNEEKIGRDVLNSPRYVRKYRLLKREIAKLLTEAVTDVLWTGVYVLPGPEGDMFIKKAAEFVKNSEYVKKVIRDAVFERYSLDDALNIAAICGNEIVRNTIYAEYLISITRHDGKGMFNPVLGMYWDAKNRRWFTPLGERFQYFPMIPASA